MFVGCGWRINLCSNVHQHWNHFLWSRRWVQQSLMATGWVHDSLDIEFHGTFSGRICSVSVIHTMIHLCSAHFDPELWNSSCTSDMGRFQYRLRITTSVHRHKTGCGFHSRPFRNAIASAIHMPCETFWIRQCYQWRYTLIRTIIFITQT